MMRFFPTVVLMVALTQPGQIQGRGQFESANALAAWMTFYYQHPEPQRIVDAMLSASRFGLLRGRTTGPPLFGFLAGWFRENDDAAEAVVEKLLDLPPEDLAILVSGLWYSNASASRAALVKYAPRMPSQRELMGGRVDEPSPGMLGIPLEQGPWVLDALWGNFFATGKEDPVVRLMTALPWTTVEQKDDRRPIGDAARWSLTSNAVQHPRVLAICRSQQERQPKDIANVLAEVIKQAERELKKEAAAATGELPPGDALIDRARRALGGDSLAAVKTLSIHAWMSLEFGGTTPAVSRTVDVSFMSPDRYLRVGRYRPNWPVDLELTYYDGFNGASPIRELIASIPQFPLFIDGPRVSEDVKAYRARVLAAQQDDFIQMMLPLFLAQPDNFGLTFADGGKVAYEGGSAQMIVVARRGGHRWEMLLDEKSGLPVRLSWQSPPFSTKQLPSVARRTEPGGAVVPTNPPPIVFPVDAAPGAPDVDWVMTIGDYRQADGLNWPRRFVTTVEGRRHTDWRVAEYRINPRIDPKVFER